VAATLEFVRYGNDGANYSPFVFDGGDTSGATLLSLIMAVGFDNPPVVDDFENIWVDDFASSEAGGVFVKKGME
jgi:hypothetical protein